MTQSQQTAACAMPQWAVPMPGQGQGHRRPVFTSRQPITSCLTT